jgi:hypothetical protein
MLAPAPPAEIPVDGFVDVAETRARMRPHDDIGPLPPSGRRGDIA